MNNKETLQRDSILRPKTGPWAWVTAYYEILEEDYISEILDDFDLSPYQDKGFEKEYFASWVDSKEISRTSSFLKGLGYDLLPHDNFGVFASVVDYST